MAKLNWTEAQKEEFYRKNEALIHDVAHSFSNIPVEYADLFQLACEGLTKAFNKYDDSRGVKFTSYAVACMKKEILYRTRSGRAKSRSGKLLVSLNGENSDSDGDSMCGYDNVDLSKVDGLHMAVPMEEAVEQRELYEKILEICDHILSEQEKSALIMSSMGHTQAEIAKKLDLAQARVSKIVRGAKCKIILYCKRNNIEYA